MTASHISRRTVLSGIAAVPVASASVVALPNPDHELLSAYDEALDLEAKYQRAAELSGPNWAATEAWANQPRGLLRRNITDGEYIAAMLEIEKRHPLPSPSCDELTDMMDVPMRKVMDLPAHTPRGLAAKAQLVRMQFNALWDKSPDELEWREMLLKALVDGVHNYAADTKEDAQKAG